MRPTRGPRRARPSTASFGRIRKRPDRGGDCLLRGRPARRYRGNAAFPRLDPADSGHLRPPAGGAPRRVRPAHGDAADVGALLRRRRQRSRRDRRRGGDHGRRRPARRHPHGDRRRRLLPHGRAARFPRRFSRSPGRSTTTSTPPSMSIQSADASCSRSSAASTTPSSASFSTTRAARRHRVSPRPPPRRSRSAHADSRRLRRLRRAGLAACVPPRVDARPGPRAPAQRSRRRRRRPRGRPRRAGRRRRAHAGAGSRASPVAGVAG